MGFFSNVWKSITGALSNFMRQTGESLVGISTYIQSLGVDTTNTTIINTIHESINEVDKYGIFDDYGKNQPVSLSDMVESTDSMQRNYRSLFEVEIYDPRNNTSETKLVSLYHDYNVGGKQLSKTMKEKMTDYEKYNETNYTLIRSMRRVLVYHKAGSKY